MRCSSYALSSMLMYASEKPLDYLCPKRPLCVKMQAMQCDAYAAKKQASKVSRFSAPKLAVRPALYHTTASLETKRIASHNAAHPCPPPSAPPRTPSPSLRPQTCKREITRAQLYTPPPFQVSSSPAAHPARPLPQTYPAHVPAHVPVPNHHPKPPQPGSGCPSQLALGFVSGWQSDCGSSHDLACLVLASLISLRSRQQQQYLHHCYHHHRHGQYQASKHPAYYPA